ncbi:putative Myb/SANT-like domain-containing protein [Helianthus annuus]|nr:putative Myb/SANT-like domain-containing protein [Helianthus annuus]KAJ0824952.1 putative Myb/SANT-like domain-containing protein [Helianthus annuus]
MGRLSTKKHKWTKIEDEALISSLTELCQSGWKRDNNIFRSGYTTVLEKELKSKLPGCNLKASPHIESRLKTLKKHCDAITDMKDAFGIEWRSADCMLICYDDDVWDDWVKDHSDAKGLRNKPFPYYDELCFIFGKHRGNHRIVEDASDANRAVETYETSEYVGHMSKHKQFKVSVNDEANGHKGDDMAADDDSNDNDNDDLSIDDATHAANKKGHSSNWSSRTEGLVKIIEALIKKQDEQFSVLVGIVGIDVATDKAAADKRTKLNGELKKIPNLSLQARLRAASVIVGDSAKLDLFYSLSNEERKEWVSMLLSGLI